MKTLDGFMQQQPVDIAKSIAITKVTRSLAQKECYRNVFRTFTTFPDKFKSGEWTVAYGYVSISKDLPLLARHCFITTKDGTVLDPTLALQERFRDEAHTYYITKQFCSWEEYWSLLKNEKWYPALMKGLKNEDTLAREWCQKNGFVPIGL